MSLGEIASVDKHWGCFMNYGWSVHFRVLPLFHFFSIYLFPPIYLSPFYAIAPRQLHSNSKSTPSQPLLSSMANRRVMMHGMLTLQLLLFISVISVFPKEFSGFVFFFDWVQWMSALKIRQSFFWPERGSKVSERFFIQQEQETSKIKRLSNGFQL